MEYAYAAVIFGVVLLPMLIGGVGALRAWRRTHALRPYVESPAGPPGAYAAEMMESATRDHGYRWVGAACDADAPTLAIVLLASADGRTLALVQDGTRGSERVLSTYLVSRTPDGRELATSDLPMVDLDPLVAWDSLLNADFGELVRLHASRLTVATEPWPADVGWAFLNEYAATATARSIASGRARAVGDGMCYRMTLRSIVRRSLGARFHAFWHPPPARRLYKPRPGSTTPAPPPADVATATERPADA